MVCWGTGLLEIIGDAVEILLFTVKQHKQGFEITRKNGGVNGIRKP